MDRFFSTVTTLTWLIASMPLTAAGLVDALGQCARIGEDAKRLACFDRLSSENGVLIVAPLDQAAERQSPAEALGVAINDEKATGQAHSSPTETSTKKGRWLGIRPYRRNYILPVTYNSRLNRDQLLEDGGGYSPEKVEMKFQLSFELPIWENMLVDDLDLYFAYTQLSFFQAYNSEYSSPFRDTAYEPELGLHWQPDFSWSGWEVESLRFSLNHQSNGRTEPLSRSWNRVISQLKVRNEDFRIGVRLWDRVAESADNDDNPDIVDYLGHGEVFAGYERGSHRYGLMLRNPFEYSAVQLDWSYLLTENVRLYVQYFNGYGESLIDYNRRVNRVGVGFLLNEWP